MADLIPGAVTNFNGTTWVTAVAAGASGKRRQILACYVENLDSVPHVFRQARQISGTEEDLYPELTLDAFQKGFFHVDGIVISDAQNYRVVMDAAHTSTAPRFEAHAFEAP
jgi:hypothetical protein